MRFMVMHKMTAELEKGLPPDPAIIAGVHALIGEGLENKVFVGGEGLRPSAERMHISYRSGERTVLDGPFTEAKELIGGFALMVVRSKEELLHWCDRYAQVLGDVELHVGAVVEGWHLGMMPKPVDPPLRFLSLHQVDARSEQDGPPSQDMMAKMGALIEEMTKAGVLQATGGVAGTKYGARIHYKNGKATVTDGPFAESKELIAGYALLELPSKAAAIEWALRFGEVVKVNEVEVRQFPEW